jgi:hypothetical protein
MRARGARGKRDSQRKAAITCLGTARQLINSGVHHAMTRLALIKVHVSTTALAVNATSRSRVLQPGSNVRHAHSSATTAVLTDRMLMFLV